MNTQIIKNHKILLALIVCSLLLFFLSLLNSQASILSVSVLDANSNEVDNFEEREVITPYTFESKEYNLYLDEDGHLKEL